MTSIHSLSFPQVGSLGVDYSCLLSDLLQINMKQKNKQTTHETTKKKKKKGQMSVYHKADPGELIR